MALGVIELGKKRIGQIVMQPYGYYHFHNGAVYVMKAFWIRCPILPAVRGLAK